jgi:aerotaxis receptor
MSPVTPIDEEYVFHGSAIISQTDAKGIITFANRKFCEVSGYKASELIGQNHNIVRHPDMPKILYEKMWEKISDGQSWKGIIKNIRSDGKFYWVDSEILPIRNKWDEITGYISTRKAATLKDVQESEELYKKMISEEK